MGRYPQIPIRMPRHDFAGVASVVPGLAERRGAELSGGRERGDCKRAAVLGDAQISNPEPVRSMGDKDPREAWKRIMPKPRQ